MDEQTSWKGHSFTLFVFVGIVVLCSIFFVLGMLVGRTQSGPVLAQASEPASGPAENPAVKVPEKTAVKPPEKAPEMTFFDSVKKAEPAPLEPLPAPASKPAVAAPPPAAPPVVAPAPGKRVTFFQVAALKKPADAEKLVRELKAKGFPAFILSPAAGDAVPYHRVQVGPFAENEVADAQVKLQDAGYKQLVVKR